MGVRLGSGFGVRNSPEYALNPEEVLSPGQSEELDRIYRSYPHLNDDEFVADNLDRWMNV